MLPKRHRLKRDADIRRLYRQGERRRHPLLTLYVAPTALAAGGPDRMSDSRFAVSASRRVGNAVVRNRCKRLVREAIRAHLASVEPGWDCLFVVRAALTGAPYIRVEAAVCHLFSQAGLLESDPGP